jgi:oxygen-independent coproporphyrinogen-3 oxidase
MSCLYVHIPFCSQACHYCDFHFSTDNSGRAALVKAICRELQMQGDYLNTRRLKTIYYGGGTPSILHKEELRLIHDCIHNLYDIQESAEITLEANPEDLTEPKIKFLLNQGINRLSIGVQSLDDASLIRLNRVHQAADALNAISRARDAGFRNISIDLIFGIPGRGKEILENDLKKILDLNPEHLSIYGLTIEPKTVFGVQLKSGKFTPVNDDQQADEYELICEVLENHGYRHYEVSNFSKPGYESIHNTNYWKQLPYLGIGPGAHSYNGVSRQFNISNNPLYEKSIENNKIPFEREILSRANKINEYLMTSLRTETGCNLQKLTDDFEYNLELVSQPYISNLITSGKAILKNRYLKLTRKGLLVADKISSDLFTV